MTSPVRRAALSSRCAYLATLSANPLIARCKTDVVDGAETCVRGRAGTRRGHDAWLPVSEQQRTPVSATSNSWLLCTGVVRVPLPGGAEPPGVNEQDLQACLRRAETGWWVR
jgi:hypothetical protein